jgi:gas vesicle protein
MGGSPGLVVTTLWIIGTGIVLHAQTEPISGGAGWVGAGLLGAVLAWLLLKHLPAKDKQVTDMMARRDQVVKEVADKHAVTVKDLVITFAEQQRETRMEFKEALKTMMAQHDRQVSELASAMKREFAEITKPIQEIRERP